jgi:hypothetical protein
VDPLPGDRSRSKVCFRQVGLTRLQSTRESCPLQPGVSPGKSRAGPVDHHDLRLGDLGTISRGGLETMRVHSQRYQSVYLEAISGDSLDEISEETLRGQDLRQRTLRGERTARGSAGNTASEVPQRTASRTRRVTVRSASSRVYRSSVGRSSLAGASSYSRNRGIISLQDEEPRAFDFANQYFRCLDQGYHPR